MVPTLFQPTKWFLSTPKKHIQNDNQNRNAHRQNYIKNFGHQRYRESSRLSLLRGFGECLVLALFCTNLIRICDFFCFSFFKQSLLLHRFHHLLQCLLLSVKLHFHYDLSFFINWFEVLFNSSLLHINTILSQNNS